MIASIIIYLYSINSYLITGLSTYVIGKALQHDHLDSILKSLVCSNFLVLCIIQLYTQC